MTNHLLPHIQSSGEEAPAGGAEDLILDSQVGLTRCNPSSRRANKAVTFLDSVLGRHRAALALIPGSTNTWAIDTPGSTSAEPNSVAALPITAAKESLSRSRSALACCRGLLSTTSRPRLCSPPDEAGRLSPLGGLRGGAFREGAM